MPLCLSTSNHHSRLHLFPPLFPCSSSPSLWSCALLFGDARRKHHHHREPSHLIPPEPCFITGGAAHVITDPLPAVTSVTYRIWKGRAWAEGEKGVRGGAARSPPPPVLDLYRRDPLATVVDPYCQRASNATSLTSRIGWWCGARDKLW